MMQQKPKISLIAYDFDGVMTDNRAFLSETGEESVCVNRSDGLAVNLIKKLGIPQVIISTEQNPIVLMRAKKLGIEAVNAVENKKATLEKICSKKDIDIQNVIFVGNDLNDFEVMKHVGFPVAPNDAADVIKSIAIYITPSNGGYGVVRDLYEFLAKNL